MAIRGVAPRSRVAAVVGLAVIILAPLLALETTAAFAGGRHLARPAAGAAVSEQYTASRTDRSLGQAARQRFIREAATISGLYYDTDFVDYLRVGGPAGAAAEVVVPRTYRVEAVEVGAGGSAVQSVQLWGGEDVGAGDALAFPSGPGFVFNPVSGSWYQLTTSRGGMRSYWNKYKYDSLFNGNGWWQYQRKAVATPAEIPGTNDIVTTMGMRSYPRTTTRPILRGWYDYSPAVGVHHYNSCPQTVALGNPIYGRQFSFQACGNYDVARNPGYNDAGDLSVNWWNNPNPARGTVEMGSSAYVFTDPNATPYFNDHQYVNFYSEAYGEITAQCGSTNTHANC
jgi:hypothetical protein